MTAPIKNVLVAENPALPAGFSATLVKATATQASVSVETSTVARKAAALVQAVTVWAMVIVNRAPTLNEVIEIIALLTGPLALRIKRA